MDYKPMKDRWKEDKASDFIVEKPKIKLEPIPAAGAKNKEKE